MTAAVVVVGPTASGKTALAVRLAELLDTEIVSADSMQFYRHMAIGTGAPSEEELHRVRHHFVGFLDPADDFSAGAFAEQARAVVDDLNTKGKVAVVAGGSGLYVSALIDGLFDGPSKVPHVRETLHRDAQAQGVPALYARLEALDPDYAERINPGDLRRIVRALEVHAVTGRPLSELHAEHRRDLSPLDAVQVGLDLPRDLLYERINRRVDTMLAQGLLDEVRWLLDHGYEPAINRLRSLGYREIAAHIKGELALEEAVELMKRNTRRYAKRQLSWFRGDQRIQWIPVEENTTPEALAESVLQRLGEACGGSTGETD